MKKLLNLLFLSLLSFNLSAQCNWSKVYLAQTNKCNKYTFEITGVADSCHRTLTTISYKKTGKIIGIIGSKSYSVTFSDTGKYNVFVRVNNNCKGCDTTFEITVYVTCTPCDWSKVGFYYTNKCRTYTFELGSNIDTCVKYITQRYNLRTKHIDTLYGRVFTTTFGDTGTYKFYVKVINSCKKCDTTFYNIVKVDCIGNLSITEINSTRIIITPNPVDAGFEVNLSPFIRYEIYGLSGKIVQTGLICENKYISTTDLKNGLYYLKTNSALQSFIIER